MTYWLPHNYPVPSILSDSGCLRMIKSSPVPPVACCIYHKPPLYICLFQDPNFPPIVYLLPEGYEEMSTQPEDVHLPPSLGDEMLPPGLAVMRKKRNPGCVKKCLLSGTLHPAQCHYLCWVLSNQDTITTIRILRRLAEYVHIIKNIVWILICIVCPEGGRINVDCRVESDL